LCVAFGDKKAAKFVYVELVSTIYNLADAGDKACYPKIFL